MTVWLLYSQQKNDPLAENESGPHQGFQSVKGDLHIKCECHRHLLSKANKQKSTNKAEAIHKLLTAVGDIVALVLVNLANHYLMKHGK